MRRPLTAVALLLLAPLAMAQAYKWTDASGTVHYADSPPPKGTQFKRVTTTGTVESPVTPSEKPASEHASLEPPPKPVADTPENRTKLCTTLRSNLDLLRSKQPVVTQDGGQQKLLDDTQRKQQQATAEGQYKQFCPNQ
ncbi:protein of unknown function [Dyella sp. OK004]|uniref:DUF4124 domain-containing protein n=1 Tax=Dyella sp. OK004 TaxID=1855292 RepID=UPI0008E05A88|nr:DUF4124 domain-containing protein [Dyella sp. OK004]SFS06724.1 protein of unknown function [Dyella sp. OK004]